MPSGSTILLEIPKSYDAIVMNPPFSATGGRVNGHRSTFGIGMWSKRSSDLNPVAVSLPSFGRRDGNGPADVSSLVVFYR